MLEAINKILDNSYFVNVVSEFIALFLLISIGLLIYYFSRRRHLLQFFNITESKRIIIYLSHLRIILGGALGVDDQRRSFGESAIPLTEVRLINVFQRLFNFIVPGVETLPGFLKSMLISDVDVSILPSPLTTGDVERSDTLVSIGSPGYNMASNYIETSLHPAGTFTNDNSSISISGLQPISDLRCGFVQRVYNQTTGQMAFYLAGMSSLGTYGSVIFLAKRWRYLSKKYRGTCPFCIVIKVTSNDGQQSEIILER
jgi:hypothetical protein